MFCTFVCETWRLLWTNLGECNIIPCTWVTIEWVFFPVELKLLGRTVVLGALCGLKAWCLKCLFFRSYFKFFLNNAFLIHLMGFVSVPELHVLKQEFLCMALADVDALNPAMNKIWVIKPISSRLLWRSKPHFHIVLNWRWAWGFLLCLHRVVWRGLVSFASPTSSSCNCLAVSVSVCCCASQAPRLDSASWWYSWSPCILPAGATSLSFPPQSCGSSCQFLWTHQINI